MALASSAVIAVVIMGFYLNYHRALCISPEVVEVMHEFYEIVAWMLNTVTRTAADSPAAMPMCRTTSQRALTHRTCTCVPLALQVIFFIAGYKLGSLFVFFGLLGDNSILGWFALYPGVLLTRGLTIMLLYPVLKLLGLGLDWKTAVVMWWGGLRGSVGLALALIIHHTEYSYKAWGGSREEDPDTHELLCRDIPRDTLFVNCIIVLLTVVVNGSTVRAARSAHPRQSLLGYSPPRPLPAAAATLANPRTLSHPPAAGGAAAQDARDDDLAGGPQVHAQRRR